MTTNATTNPTPWTKITHFTTNALASQELPLPGDAKFFKLLAQPSKICLRAYGPDSASAWSAVVELFSTDLSHWDSKFIIKLTISNTSPDEVSIEVPCAQEFFGVKVTLTGSVGSAQTNNVQGLNVSLQRGW